MLQLEIKKWKDLHEQDIVKIESIKQEYDFMAKQVFDGYSMVIIYWFIVSDVMTEILWKDSLKIWLNYTFYILYIIWNKIHSLYYMQ